MEQYDVNTLSPAEESRALNRLNPRSLFFLLLAAKDDVPYLDNDTGRAPTTCVAIYGLFIWLDCRPYSWSISPGRIIRLKLGRSYTHAKRRWQPGCTHVTEVSHNEKELCFAFNWPFEHPRRVLLFLCSFVKGVPNSCKAPTTLRLGNTCTYIPENLVDASADNGDPSGEWLLSALGEKHLHHSLVT